MNQYKIFYFDICLYKGIVWDLKRGQLRIKNVYRIDGHKNHWRGFNFNLPTNCPDVLTVNINYEKPPYSIMDKGVSIYIAFSTSQLLKGHGAVSIILAPSFKLTEDFFKYLYWLSADYLVFPIDDKCRHTSQIDLFPFLPCLI